MLKREPKFRPDDDSVDEQCLLTIMMAKTNYGGEEPELVNNGGSGLEAVHNLRSEGNWWCVQ